MCQRRYIHMLFGTTPALSELIRRWIFVRTSLVLIQSIRPSVPRDFDEASPPKGPDSLRCPFEEPFACFSPSNSHILTTHGFHLILACMFSPITAAFGKLVKVADQRVVPVWSPSGRQCLINYHW